MKVTDGLGEAIESGMERAFRHGMAVARGEAERDRNLFGAIHAEIAVEAWGMVAVYSGDEMDVGAIRGAIQGAYAALDIFCRQPEAFCLLLGHSPLGGLLDGPAVMATLRRELERRDRIRLGSTPPME